MKPGVFETKYANYWIEDGIMNVVYAQNLIISLEVAKIMVEDRLNFSKGIAMPLLVDIRGLASVDTVSRKYLASPEAIEHVTAGALLADSIISKLAGNIYITVDKPKRPLKLFTDRDKAVKWLRQYI